MKAIQHEEAVKMLKGFPMARSIAVKETDQALSFVKNYPVVLKLLSSKAIHKTDIGGVRIVNDEQDLQKNFGELLTIAKQKKLPLEGILVQEHVSGEEVIIGLKKDPTFGHVIVFGLGGILVEVMKDVAFRVCPINTNDAEAMIQELKSKEVLFGVRGKKAVKLSLLKDLLVRFSKLPEKYPDIAELDINPLIINDREAKVVDVRIIVD